MEPQFKTSFVPKKPIASPAPGSAVSRAGGINFLTLLSIVIFLAALLFSAGIFMYKLSIQREIAQQLVQLDQAKQAFQPQFISQATRLNNRINAASRILERHIAPSEIFQLLEEYTLQTVALRSFVFADNVDGKIVVRGSGEGDSFRSIVLQSDEFGRSGYMRDVLFSGLEPNQAGNVDFTFEATLDNQLILYRRSVTAVPRDVPAVESVNDEFEDLGVFGNQGQQ